MRENARMIWLLFFCLFQPDPSARSDREPPDHLRHPGLQEDEVAHQRVPGQPGIRRPAALRALLASKGEI